MSPKSSSFSPQSGTTFGVAVWVLATLAIAQVFAVAWALISDLQVKASVAKPMEVELPLPPGEGAQKDTGPMAPPAPQPEVAKHTPAEPEKTGTAPLPEPKAPEKTAMVPKETPPAPPEEEPQDEQTQTLLSEAVALKETGDVGAALKKLKEAELRSPDHPKVAYELGDTYSQMGLSEKAKGCWEKLVHMGPQKAGQYYKLADYWLEHAVQLDKAERQQAEERQEVLNNTAAARDAANAPTKPSALDDAPRMEATPIKYLSVKNANVIRDDKETQGERLRVRIDIESLTQSPIVTRDVTVQVFFFDKTENGSIDHTTANTSPQWMTPPLNWTEGVETLDVEYFNPALPGDTEDTPKRRFHGYVVKLLYKEEQQDVLADPPNLAKLMEQGLPDGLLEDNPLLNP